MGVVEKLAFIRAGMETKRYHVVPTLGANTVAHHSCGVALLVNLLAGPDDDPAGLVMAALTHDLAEHRVGDMPSDAKRRLSAEAKEELEGAEELELRQADMYQSLYSERARRLLKFADCADGALFCCRERAMGNKLVAPTFNNYQNYLRQLDPQPGPETDIMYYIAEEWSKANG